MQHSINIIGNTFEDTNKDSNLVYNAYDREIRFDTVESLLPRGRRNRVLDQGCSIGAWYPFFKKAGFKQIYGIDISRERADKARKRGYRACVAPAQKMPFKNDYFDLVACIDVIVHILNRCDRQSAMREAFRVLKPGGSYIISIAGDKYLRISRVLDFYNAFKSNKSRQNPSYCNYSNIREAVEDLNAAGFNVKTAVGTQFIYPGLLIYAPRVLTFLDRLLGQRTPDYGRFIFIRATKPVK